VTNDADALAKTARNRELTAIVPPKRQGMTTGGFQMSRNDSLSAKPAEAADGAAGGHPNAPQAPSVCGGSSEAKANLAMRVSASRQV
jgi:hypothetical protein